MDIGSWWGSLDLEEQSEGKVVGLQRSGPKFAYLHTREHISLFTDSGYGGEEDWHECGCGCGRGRVRSTRSRAFLRKGIFIFRRF